MPNKIKIGDKIEVIGNCCCHGYQIGSIYTIGDMDQNQIWPILQDGDDDGGYLDIKDIRLYKTITTPKGIWA